MNPLLEKWVDGIPPFTRIEPVHFKPAILAGFEENIQAIVKIVAETSPTFDNTIVELDRAASLLTKVLKVFYNLCSSHSPPELQAVEMEMAGPIAVHKSNIYTFPGLFDRVQSVYNARAQLHLSPEDLRLVERVHLDFVRAGAKLDEAAKARYKDIMKELAELTTQFTQNVTADEGAFTLVLDDSEIAGLPDFLLEAAKQAAVERSIQSGYVITLSRSLVVPFLTFSDRRDLREKAFKAWVSRGEMDAARDNKSLIKSILLLRAEQAQIHGYQNYAEYSTADTMARTPGAVMDLLERVWTPAKVSLANERAALEESLLSLPPEERYKIEPWDWRYLAEKVRTARFSVDEAALKPYFPLKRMVAAVFDCANQLYGLRFVPRTDLVTYHADVVSYEVWETVDGSDRLVGIFLHDNYGRQYKKSGAWMSDYRSQGRNNREGKPVTPIIVNNNNFAKSADTLLSFDDVVTLFHEFGHGLHGLLSDVKYNRLAGTSVLKDFVELPSQLMEHWCSQPEVLKKHALHYKTQEPIPDELLEKLLKARSFNQGFATVEYTICALVDQSIHKLSMEEIKSLDVNDFEAKELRRLGMPSEVVPRHRFPHFQRKST